MVLGWFSCVEAELTREAAAWSFAGRRGFACEPGAACAALPSWLVEGAVVSAAFAGMAWWLGTSQVAA